MTALRPPVVDRLLAAAVLVLSLVAAIVMETADLDVERSLDVWGAALLAAMAALLLARRRWPMGVLLGVVAAGVALVVATGVSTADDASDIPADVLIEIGWLLVALLAGLALRFHRA